MTEEYKRYMRSREWDAKRQQRLDVDEHCCAMCGRPEAKCRNLLPLPGFGWTTKVLYHRTIRTGRVKIIINKLGETLYSCIA